MFKTTKVCIKCEKPFPITSPAQKYCPDCVPRHKTKEYKDESARIQNRKKGKMVGIGSGNHPAIKGENHYNYKHGGYAYKKKGKALLAKLGACERCNKNLRGLTNGYWCCHHKDRDRTNSSDENLELLRKSCHQKEHKAAAHLNK